MAVLSMIALSSLYDKSGCSFFCWSVFHDGQPQSNTCERIPKYSSSGVTNIISSAVMKSGMSMHYCTALMVMHMPGISSSLTVQCNE